MVTWPVKPSRLAFMRVIALPSLLRARVDLCALRRFASICFCVAMVCSVRLVLRYGDSTAEMSWMAKLLKNRRKIVVTRNHGEAFCSALPPRVR